MDVSLIICTHNPRPHYLRRVLDALRAQTLPKERWELLLVDNASKESLSADWDLSWHPRARHVREDELGLTHARLRGIRESRGDFLVFADDDNILAPDYLEEAARIFQDWPQLGVFGTGSSKGEYESPPPEWMTPYLRDLAIDDLGRDYWTNCSGYSPAVPPGAGLCVRRNVAEDYAQKATTNPLRRLLGRSGTGMGACEDSDLAYCAFDLGMGAGRFISLKLIHLIPSTRLTEDYIVRLHAGFAWSGEILSSLRNKRSAPQAFSPMRPIRFLINVWRKKGIERRIFLASEKARREARQLMAGSIMR